MKLITIIAAFFAATYASAMPTNEAIAKAGAEVQTRIKEQLASWQSGKMSDADMGKLLLIMADGEQD